MKKGESYWWWSFKTAYSSSKRYSKTRPRPSQLTQSEFLSTLYAIQERIEDLEASNFDDIASIESERDDIVSELEQLKDETQDKFDNMPDGLQQGDTGQMLEERVSSLESFISDLEGVSASEDEEEPVQEFINELQQQTCDAS